MTSLANSLIRTGCTGTIATTCFMCFIEYVFAFLLCGTCSLAPNDEFQSRERQASRGVARIILQPTNYATCWCYFGLYSD